jgi:hypothetical protein
MEEVPPSVRVVEAVARREGIDTTEVTPPLFETVDTDALDALLSATPDRSPEHVEVSFRYRGYHVTVERDDGVEVGLRPAPAETEGAAQSEATTD